MAIARPDPRNPHFCPELLPWDAMADKMEKRRRSTSEHQPVEGVFAQLKRMKGNTTEQGIAAPH